MKYIITDKDEAVVGINTYHQILAEQCSGKVIRAGECRKREDGSYEVFGKSYGYGIDAKPEDAILLKKLLVNK